MSMVEDHKWTPQVLDELLVGEWRRYGEFSAAHIATSAKTVASDSLFVGYSDDTFRRYMGDCNFVYFADQGKKFGNLDAALRAAREGRVQALVVERELPVDVPQLVVDDAFAALERLAEFNRSRVQSRIVAVTGTVGKSSTLRALASVFGHDSGVLSRSNTRRPLALGMANLAVGNPQNVIFAEVSVSALWGESGGIGRILRPDIAVLTEVGLGMTHRVPTEFDTAVVKANLFDYAPSHGLALINADMKFSDYVKGRAISAGREVQSFGFDSDADFYINDVQLAQGSDESLRQKLNVTQGGLTWKLSIPAIGAAHAYANVAAFGVAAAVDRNLDVVAEKIGGYVPSKTVEKIYSVSDPDSGFRHTVVDGTFSATPLSMLSSFNLAAQVRDHHGEGQGDLVAVIARIVALEGQGDSAHRDLAKPLADAGYNRVYTYGPDVEELNQGLRELNVRVQHFDSPNGLIEQLVKTLPDSSVVLLKGSKRASDFRLVRESLNEYFRVNTEARLVRVAGEVQGVGFRRWAMNLAEELGVVGWTRNLDDDVEILVQGQRKRVDAFLELCQQGPSGAHVALISSQATALRKRLTRFRIRSSYSAAAGEDESESSTSAKNILQEYGPPSWPSRFSADVVRQAFGSQKLSSFCIALEAWRRGLEVTFSSPAGVRFTIDDGQKSLSFNGSRSSLTTPQAIRMVDNKNQTLKCLRTAGVPTPRSRMFDTSLTDQESVVSVAKRDYRWPVVVKPIRGSRGEGVFANINTTDELRQCLRYIIDELGKPHVLLEEHARGDDYRVYVVGDTVAAACRRIPAHVIGDGESSVKELIRGKNAERRKNPFLSKGLIKHDVEIKSLLERQSLALDSVPDNGQYVQLRQKANASAGGDVEDVTHTLPATVKRAAVAAVSSVPGLAAAGVDVLLDPADDNGFVIIELNARAHIGVNMYPTIGSGVDVPSVLLDKFFPETSGETDERADSLLFDLATVLEPLQLGTASKVEVNKVPKERYPTRLFFEFDEVVTLTDRQQRRLRLASRSTGAASSLEMSRRHSRLVVGGRHDQVEAFVERASWILGRQFPPPSDNWDGLIVQGFHVRFVAEEATSRGVNQ